MDIPKMAPWETPPDHVAPDALPGIKRRQTNPARWNGEGWGEFVASLERAGIEVIEQATRRGTFATDAGGIAWGKRSGCRSTKRGPMRVITLIDIA